MSRVLAIDIGTVRIGVAVSDENRIVASPVKTLEARPREPAIDAIVQLAEELESNDVVFGLPLELSGSEGRAAKRTRRFVQALETAAPSLRTHAWDERMTSVVAERALIESDMSRDKRKRVVDQAAATLILQSWLDAH